MPQRGPRAAVLRGVGLALAVAVPAALVAQVVEAVTGDDPGLLTYPLALVVLAGMAVGGAAVGQRIGPDGAARLGALAGFLAIAAVQVLGIGRRAAADEGVAWDTVPVVTILAVALASGAAVLTSRRKAGRTRP